MEGEGTLMASKGLLQTVKPACYALSKLLRRLERLTRFALGQVARRAELRIMPTTPTNAKGLTDIEMLAASTVTAMVQPQCLTAHSP
jgi:hypothetical protein